MPGSDTQHLHQRATHLSQTGWNQLTRAVVGHRDIMALGHVRALDEDAVGIDQVTGKSVAPPRPKLVPRPGRVAECQIRAWFSIWIAPSAVNSFLIR
jgi:hypothetical protein